MELHFHPKHYELVIWGFTNNTLIIKNISQSAVLYHILKFWMCEFVRVNFLTNLGLPMFNKDLECANIFCMCKKSWESWVMSASLVTLKHCQNSIQSVCPLTHLHLHIVRCFPVQGLQPRSICWLITQWCIQGLNLDVNIEEGKRKKRSSPWKHLKLITDLG